MVKCGSRLVHTSQKSFSISSDNTDKPFTFSRVPHRSLNHSLTLIPAPIKPELDTPLITPHPWVCSWNTSRQGAWDGITDTRPSPRLFYHMWSTERTWTVTPQHNPECFYRFPTGLCFYLMQLFKFLFFRSHTVKTVNQKNPTILCQLPGALLHKVFSHVSVISFLTVLRANNKEFSHSGTWAAPQIALQDLTKH